MLLKRFIIHPCSWLMVEQLGGSIGFDTEIDHGTRFFVGLNYRPW